MKSYTSLASKFNKIERYFVFNLSMFERPHSKSYLFDEFNIGAVTYILSWIITNTLSANAMRQIICIHCVCTGTNSEAIQYSPWNFYFSRTGFGKQLEYLLHAIWYALVRENGTLTTCLWRQTTVDLVWSWASGYPVWDWISTYLSTRTTSLWTSIN